MLVVVGSTTLVSWLTIVVVVGSTILVSQLKILVVVGSMILVVVGSMILVSQLKILVVVGSMILVVVGSMILLSFKINLGRVLRLFISFGHVRAIPTYMTYMILSSPDDPPTCLFQSISPVLWPQAVRPLEADSVEEESDSVLPSSHRGSVFQRSVKVWKPSHVDAPRLRGSVSYIVQLLP